MFKVGSESKLSDILSQMMSTRRSNTAWKEKKFREFTKLPYLFFSWKRMHIGKKCQISHFSWKGHSIKGGLFGGLCLECDVCTLQKFGFMGKWPLRSNFEIRPKCKMMWKVKTFVELLGTASFLGCLNGFGHNSNFLKITHEVLCIIFLLFRQTWRKWFRYLTLKNCSKYVLDWIHS